MITIRRGDMHHVNVRTAQELVIFGEHARNPEPIGDGTHPIRQIAQRDYLDPQPAQGLDMDRADEAGADHAGAELIHFSSWAHKRCCRVNVSTGVIAGRLGQVNLSGVSD